MALHDDFKAEAQSLGFSLTGITGPQPPAHTGVYEDWLAAGRHGTMAYLAAEEARRKRARPDLILPGLSSIFVVGVRYPAAVEIDAPSTQPTGRVAAYAWGQDYHNVIPARLDDLLQKLEGLLGRSIPHRSYTDTGPILERDLGQRAGLGWAGKNTCLIAPQKGSYFFLGELLTGGAQLEPDPPFQADLCGSCTRCIDACPTGCILPDRTIDAVRCISYQTIENKGPIRPDLRASMGDWVFGCDICQQVCPWNIRFAGPEHDPAYPAFQPREEIARPVLRQELELTPQEFNQKFKTSPIRRAKRRGYLRNVTVALGNSGDDQAVPELVRVIQNEPEPLVRAHAAWALGRSGSLGFASAPALAALERAKHTETDPMVIEEIENAIQMF